MVGRRERKRKYSPGFKLEAVRLMNERLASGLTLQRVSEELEVDPDQLRRWARAMASAPPNASPEEIFPGHGRRRAYALQIPSEIASPEANVEEENRRLRRENERLRQERDFLKKATAFFAKESQ
jgi:transposase-like protein